MFYTAINEEYKYKMQGTIYGRLKYEAGRQHVSIFHTFPALLLRRLTQASHPAGPRDQGNESELHASKIKLSTELSNHIHQLHELQAIHWTKILNTHVYHHHHPGDSQYLKIYSAKVYNVAS